MTNLILVITQAIIGIVLIVVVVTMIIESKKKNKKPTQVVYHEPKIKFESIKPVEDFSKDIAEAAKKTLLFQDEVKKGKYQLKGTHKGKKMVSSAKTLKNIKTLQNIPVNFSSVERALGLNRNTLTNIKRGNQKCLKTTAGKIQQLIDNPKELTRLQSLYDPVAKVTVFQLSRRGKI